MTSQQFPSPTYEEISAVCGDIFSSIADQQSQGLFILAEVRLPTSFVEACNECLPIQAYLMGLAIGMRIQQRRTEVSQLEDLFEPAKLPPGPYKLIWYSNHNPAGSLWQPSDSKFPYVIGEPQPIDKPFIGYLGNTVNPVPLDQLKAEGYVGLYKIVKQEPDSQP